MVRSEISFSMKCFYEGKEKRKKEGKCERLLLCESKSLFAKLERKGGGGEKCGGCLTLRLGRGA